MTWPKSQDDEIISHQRGFLELEPGGPRDFAGWVWLHQLNLAHGHFLVLNCENMSSYEMKLLG